MKAIALNNGATVFVPAGEAAAAPAGTTRVVELVPQDNDGKELARDPIGTEHATANGETVVRKVHEADKVIVPKFPKITNLKQ